jgi:hypothetical protein
MEMVLTTLPVTASSSEVDELPKFATHTWTPSEEIPSGRLPTAIDFVTIGGVTGGEAADGGDVPTPLDAVTVNV